MAVRRARATSASWLKGWPRRRSLKVRSACCDCPSASSTCPSTSWNEDRSAAGSSAAGRKNLLRSSSVAHGHQDVGFELWYIVVEDAIGVTVGKSVQQSFGACFVSRLVVGSCTQIVRVVGQILAGLAGPAEVGFGLLIALVEPDRHGPTPDRPLQPLRRCSGVHRQQHPRRRQACAWRPVAGPWGAVRWRPQTLV